MLYERFYIFIEMLIRPILYKKKKKKMVEVNLYQIISTTKIL